MPCLMPATEASLKTARCPDISRLTSHLLDGSQIYGSTEAITQSLRNMDSDGKLTLDKRGREQFIPRDADGNVLTGFSKCYAWS